MTADGHHTPPAGSSRGGRRRSGPWVVVRPRAARRRTAVPLHAPVERCHTARHGGPVDPPRRRPLPRRVRHQSPRHRLGDGRRATAVRLELRGAAGGRSGRDRPPKRCCSSCGCGGPAAPGTRSRGWRPRRRCSTRSRPSSTTSSATRGCCCPALVAGGCGSAGWERVRRIISPGAASMLEGFVWGVAVWVKPHVVVPACRGVAGVGRADRPARVGGACCGTSAGLLGGLIAGAAGVAWLVAHRRVAAFLDVFLNWNPGYLAGVCPRHGIGSRSRPTASARGTCCTSWPCLCGAGVLGSRMWSRRPGKPRTGLGSPGSTRRRKPRRSRTPACSLAAIYLGWFAQVVAPPEGVRLRPGAAPAPRDGGGRDAPVGVRVRVPRVVRRSRRGAELHDLVDTAQEVDPRRCRPCRLNDYPLTDPQIVALWPRCWRRGQFAGTARPTRPVHRHPLRDELGGTRPGRGVPAGSSRRSATAN